jgi:hypothetical protein
VAEQVLGGVRLTPSKNSYDWLGHGIYFWEANPKRGLEFARELARKPRSSSKVKNPAVIGAVIDLGLCLDLTTSAGISMVSAAHRALLEIGQRLPGGKLPENSKDGLRRALDCAVINTLHDIRADSGQPAVDSVKGIFIEGVPIYSGSGFYAKTHTQICVRNPNCIKGVFRLSPTDLD